MGSARTRATVSVGPPAENDTTIVIGRDGKVSARAPVVVAKATAIRNEARGIVTYLHDCRISNWQGSVSGYASHSATVQPVALHIQGLLWVMNGPKAMSAI